MCCRDKLSPSDDRQPLDAGGGDPFAAWIAAARAGCDDAFKRLYEALTPYLRVIANKELVPELQSKVGGSDLVDETLTHAWQKFAQFRGTSQVELKAWTRDMLLKNVHDAKRRYLWTEMRQASRELSLDRDLPVAQQLVDAGATGPGQQLASEEETQWLAAAIAQLPHDYREVIRLRNWEGRSFGEIGLSMARSSEAAGKLWARAIDRLREILYDSDGERSA